MAGVAEHTSRQKRRRDRKQGWGKHLQESPWPNSGWEGRFTKAKEVLASMREVFLAFLYKLAWPHLSCVCQRERSELRFLFWTQIKVGSAWALLRHAGFHSSCSFMTPSSTVIQIKYDPSFYLTPAIRAKCQAYLDSSHSEFTTECSVFLSRPFSTPSVILTRNIVCSFNQSNADECELLEETHQNHSSLPGPLHPSSFSEHTKQMLLETNFRLL